MVVIVRQPRIAMFPVDFSYMFTLVMNDSVGIGTQTNMIGRMFL